MFTRFLRLASYTAVINAPNPPVWSLWGCVMKMLSILRKFARSRARRRVTPSPASMIYWLPLTTSRFDDCARPASRTGPFFVPNVMTRVLFLDDTMSLFDCPQATGDTASEAAALAAKCRKMRRRSFMMPSINVRRRPITDHIRHVSLIAHDHRLVSCQSLNAHVPKSDLAHPTNAVLAAE